MINKLIIIPLTEINRFCYNRDYDTTIFFRKINLENMLDIIFSDDTNYNQQIWELIETSLTSYELERADLTFIEITIEQLIDLVFKEIFKYIGENSLNMDYRIQHKLKNALCLKIIEANQNVCASRLPKDYSSSPY